MEIETDKYKLQNLSTINVVLGKNGSGKSILLKYLDKNVAGDSIGFKKYVTPERGGVLAYEAGVEHNIFSNSGWLNNTRRVNQFNQFKQQSAAQFRRLETAIFRNAEEAGEVGNFQPYVDKLNNLLDNIDIRRADPTFKLYKTGSEDEITAADISSGESELVSIGIEVLVFAQEVEAGKENLLILDEPDVHLHPDLQERLMAFICDTVDDVDCRVLIATHSTSILGGLADRDDSAVAFMKPGDETLTFAKINDVYRAVLPVFGAHPLSNVFNRSPVLIVEGEDDERIWQQAVRSSNGKLRVYPVSCEGVDSINEYEKEVDTIVTSVYDNGIAYSLRDADGIYGPLDRVGVVSRFRLNCCAAENLILADEVLAAEGIDFEEVKRRVEGWIGANMGHSRYVQMSAFRSGGYNRREANLKSVRMVLAGQIIGTNKPWEVLVGQSIGHLQPPPIGQTAPEGSLTNFLGSELVDRLLR